MPKHAPLEPSASDISPLDLLSPCKSGSQGCQQSKYLPTSATGNKYHCYDTDCHDGLLYAIMCRRIHTVQAQCVPNQSTWTVSHSSFVSAYNHTACLVSLYIKFQNIQYIWIVYLTHNKLFNC